MEETCAVCGTALARSDILYSPDGRVVCAKHFAEIDPSVGGTSAPWRVSAIVGGIAGAIPFGIHISSSSMSTVNGHVTSFVYRDWPAVICGVIAMICGVLTVVAARKEQLRRTLAFAAGIGVLALGGVQIARGFGVFESPPGGHSDSTSMSVSMERAPESPPAEQARPPDATKTADCAHAKRETDAKRRRSGGHRAGRRGFTVGADELAIRSRFATASASSTPPGRTSSTPTSTRATAIPRWSISSSATASRGHGPPLTAPRSGGAAA